MSINKATSRRKRNLW